MVASAAAAGCICCPTLVAVGQSFCLVGCAAENAMLSGVGLSLVDEGILQCNANAACSRSSSLWLQMFGKEAVAESQVAGVRAKWMRSAGLE